MARRTKAEQQEVLNSAVRLDGVGEDKVIQDLMSDKFAKGTNQEATDIAIALRQLISGQNTLIANQAQQSAELARVRQRMAEMDAAAEKWEKDRVGFIQEVMDKSNSLRAKDPDAIIAKGSIEAANAITMARAELHTDQLQFKEKLARMPKVTVVSPGELITVMEGGRPVNKIVPEVIRIKNVQWNLQPGVPTEVPEVVAAALKDRRRSEEETRAREQILSRHMEQGVLQNEWNGINAKYNSPSN